MCYRLSFVGRVIVASSIEPEGRNGWARADDDLAVGNGERSLLGERNGVPSAETSIASAASIIETRAQVTRAFPASPDAPDMVARLAGGDVLIRDPANHDR